MVQSALSLLTGLNDGVRNSGNHTRAAGSSAFTLSVSPSYSKHWVAFILIALFVQFVQEGGPVGPQPIVQPAEQSATPANRHRAGVRLFADPENSRAGQN